jgi:lipoyl(octanoyl) transferase
MDKKLHSVSPESGPNSNLDLTPQLAQSSSAFLFEPKNIVPFETALGWQKNFLKNLIEEPFSPQAVWLLEHFSCFTMGRGSDKKNLLFEENNSPLPVFSIERGGEVTHHMPGQIVGYLVLNLSLHKKDLSWYLRELEQVLIDVLDLLGIEGKRVDGLTGVWCEDKKVGSIGIGCKRWVTQHGFSLNVDCDLIGFEKIIPCGLDKVKVGKLSDWIPGIKVCDVKPLLRESVKRRFKLNWEKIYQSL